MVATMVVKENLIGATCAITMTADAEEAVIVMMTADAQEDLCLTDEIMTPVDANVRMTDFPKRKACLGA